MILCRVFSSILSYSTEKSQTYLRNSIFLILSAENFFQTLSKYNGDTLISEYFASNLYTSTPLANK